MRDVPVGLYVDKSMSPTNKQLDKGSGWLLQSNGTLCPTFSHNLFHAEKQQAPSEGKQQWIMSFFLFEPSVLFCLVSSQSTAIVMSGRSVLLTTPFSWASLIKRLTSSTSCTYFRGKWS